MSQLNNHRECLKERFLRYVAIESQSNASVINHIPSSKGQRILAQVLFAELRNLGYKNVVIDDKATVTACWEGSKKNALSVGFLAHLDTVDVGLSPFIKPQIVHYEGGDIVLEGTGARLTEIQFPALRDFIGQEIITTDGSSVLGSDDKAGVAVLMELAAHIRDMETGNVYFAFTPDEEIGLRGAKALDIAKRFPVDIAYTIDGCAEGEIMWENFNAARCEMVFHGVPAHPMSAKGVLVNPILMAHDFISFFNRRETPECTEGEEGYVYVTEISGNPSEARVVLNLREFETVKLERRKREVGHNVEKVRALHPTGNVSYTINDVYINISESYTKNSARVSVQQAAQILIQACHQAGVGPKIIKMRGGTDGAALAQKGIVAPNIFTGGHNFHSIYEFLPVLSLEKSFQVARHICALIATSWNTQNVPATTDMPVS